MPVSADTLRLAISEESTPGTPTAGTYDLFRTTGEGLVYEVTTTPSNEIGGLNRGIKDNILQSGTVTGEVSFELSKHVALENLMAAALANDWGSDPFGGFPGIGSDLVYDHSAHRTFTIEKRFQLDDTPTYNYHLFAGCTVNTMNLSITPNEAITGSFGFLGYEMTTPDTENGTAYNSAGSEPIMTAPLVTGIELLSPPGIDNTTGAPLGTPVAWLANGCFTGLDITINNNLRGIQCIGELGLTDTSLGRFEAAATGTLYYAADEPLDHLVDQAEFALRVTMTDENGENYQMLFPRAVFSSASALATGTNTDVMTEFGLQFLEWQGDDYAITLRISRTSPATAGVVLTGPAQSSLQPASSDEDD